MTNFEKVGKFMETFGQEVKSKSSLRAGMVETAALAFAVKNMLPKGVQMAAMAVMVEISYLKHLKKLAPS